MPVFLAIQVRRNDQMRVKGVLLDIDGTLLASNEAHARAFADAAARLGVKSNLQQIRRLIGKGGDKLIPEAFGFESESPMGRKLSASKKWLFKERYSRTLRPTAGSRSLVSRFVQEGLKVIAATSAEEAEAQQLLGQAGVWDFLKDVVSANDAKASKPDPDILQAAVERIGEPKRAVMMVGDTPYDVEAAQRAGIRVIAVRCGGWTNRDLEGAYAICEDPAEILARYNEILK
jgi:HAD superfamily hydrolase (TIGR01509 family)